MRHWVPCVLLLASPVAWGQPDTSTIDAINWARGIAGQFANLSNPVVSGYSLAKLGTLVCDYDRLNASVIFSQAIARINTVQVSFFIDPKTPLLPIASFTGLWKMVAASALKCDPSLASLVDTPSFELRKTDERQQANNNVIQSAMDRYIDDPDRGAQLVELVLEAGEPLVIDYAFVELFLAKLRERAPELGDQVLLKALDTVTGAPAPSATALNVLGKYLFVNRRLRDEPDVDNRFRDIQLANSVVTDFGSVRYSANPETVEAYIQALIKLINDASSATLAGKTLATANYDPTVVYAMAIQLQGHAKDLELASADALARAAASLQTSTTALAALSSAPDPYTPGAAERTRYVRDTFTAMSRKRFDEARMTASRIGDANTTRQLNPLIDYAEALAAFSSSDVETAIRYANAIRPGGVKRAMLYAGLVAKTNFTIGDPLANLLQRDAQVLPAEFRAAMLCALANALLRQHRPDQAYQLLSQIGMALNDARTAPRRARFDPARLRRVSSGAGGGTDVDSIPLGTNRFFAVVDTGQSRLNFDITVPGVSIFTLPRVLAGAGEIDVNRLQAVVAGLRDETERAAALTAIAELRLKRSTQIQ
ncbi:MAG: hypothetical protein ABI811_21300 [Acidobacteriota bacterium]